MPPADRPPAEIAIDVDLVRRLIEAQVPRLSGCPISFLAEGWDNALYRVGDDLVARLPRRALGADLVEHEQTWLGRLAPDLPLPVPVPAIAGTPTDDYPWRWSLCPWLDGRPASVEAIADPVQAATDLGEFVAALHTPAPADAPHNPHRGRPLAERFERTSDAIEAMHDEIEPVRAQAAWERAAATAPWPGPAVWVHGDLHPGNVLVHGGRVSAVIDFGDLTGGDPATDLAIAWMLFGPDERAAFRVAAAVDDDTWDRGRGWAISLGYAVLASSADVPYYMAFARRAIRAAVDELTPT